VSEVYRRLSSSVSLLLCEYGHVELVGLEQNVYGLTITPQLLCMALCMCMHHDVIV